jgi:hypothetical protein
MTNPMTDLDAYTDEELQQALARVLAQARGEVLNDGTTLQCRNSGSSTKRFSGVRSL